MGYYLGIDLGSTTTKAVVMDDREQMIGRGITNTRSNYKVATRVAGDEAMNNARFYLLRREAGAGEGSSAGLGKLFDALEANFDYLQQVDKLKSLKENCFQLSEGTKTSTRLEETHAALESIFQAMEERSLRLFSTESMKRTQFFRDIVGSEFLRLADSEGRAEGASFEELMGIYDKSIIKVENQIRESGFQERVMDTLEFTLSRQPELAGDGAAEEVKELVNNQDNGSGESSHDNHVGEISPEGLPLENTVGTGYGRQQLPFRKDQIRSEILCHGLGAHYMFPDTRTVLDIGGQDTKAIQVDEHGIVKSFQMNDRCAAGCGRYLGYIADELNIGLHELGPLSLNATRTVRINSTCTVFAGAELRERLSLGESRENILAGLHRSIILRAMSLLARSGGVFSEFTFTGGVAKNAAVVKSLTDLVREHYDVKQLNIHPDSIYTGAVGAALFALRG